jgi:pilus assembly protein CpaB
MSTFISLAVSLILAIAAVFGVRSFLTQQRLLMAKERPDIVSENTIVIAAQPMRFGRRVEAGQLKVIDWPNVALPDGAFRTVEEVIGTSGEPRYVMSAIEKEEPILASKITGPGQRATLSSALSPGMKAVSIRVNDVLGVAGFVLPGDRVDIMLTRGGSRNSAGGAYTDVLLQGVKVLAVAQNADDRSDKPSVVKTVTFEVSTVEAQKLTLAATVGSLSLALRNIASADVESIQPINITDLGGGPTSQALQQEKARTESEERLERLEQLVRNVDENVNQRIEEVQTELTKPAQAPRPVTSTGLFTGVGVYRDAARVEYKVKRLDE